MALYDIPELPAWMIHPSTLYDVTDFFLPHSLFLLPGACMGLPALVWAVRLLRLRLVQSRGGAVSTFAVYLIFSNAMELFLMPFLMAAYFQILTGHHKVHIISANFSARRCGFYLHQLVALEGILSLSHPLCCRRLSSPVVSIPLSVTLWMSAFTYDFPGLSAALYMTICALMCFVTIALWVVALRAACSPSRRDRGLVLTILAVSQFTLFFVHGPSIFFFFFKNYYFAPNFVSQIIFIFAGLRLVADPLLCVLVHKGETQRVES